MPRKKKRKKDSVDENPTPNEGEARGAEDAMPDEPEDGESADPDADPAAERTPEELLAAAERKAQEEADRALRTLAEFDNYRRRTLRDLTAATERGAASVLGDLLEVIDNFDRALEHAGDDVPESFLEGMRLVARGLHDMLDRRGVERIPAEGEPFDPELHEALTSVPSEDAVPNTILQEVQTGWRAGARVLRPAKVVVARAAEIGKDS